MYAICPKYIYLQHVQLQHVNDAHYIDLNSGNILVKVTFKSDHITDQFSNHPRVNALPHVSSGRAVGAKVSQHLSHLGINENHTTWDVADAAAKIHPVMRMR
jgi:hypothetical protein